VSLRAVIIVNPVLFCSFLLMKTKKKSVPARRPVPSVRKNPPTLLDRQGALLTANALPQQSEIHMKYGELPRTTLNLSADESAFVNCRCDPFGQDAGGYAMIGAKIPDAYSGRSIVLSYYAETMLSFSAKSFVHVAVPIPTLVHHVMEYGAPVDETSTTLFTATTQLTSTSNAILNVLLQPGIQYRVVGAGLRLTPQGAVMYTSGTIYAGYGRQYFRDGAASYLSNADMWKMRTGQSYPVSSGCTIRGTTDDTAQNFYTLGADTYHSSGAQEVFMMPYAYITGCGSSTYISAQAVVHLEVIMPPRVLPFPMTMSPVSQRYPMLQAFCSAAPMVTSANSFKSVARAIGTWVNKHGGWSRILDMGITTFADIAAFL
jgi:hypothetical protein